MKKFKQKTKKAAAKRFKITASGKIRRKRAGIRHLLEHQSPNKKKAKRKEKTVKSADFKKLRQMLPGQL
ncbi:50S ribosomal protein L35 [bacterium]|jgi:large subunit ribosomal protein L35|nr:50S ribosomal protein L35 [bacterium]